MKKRSPFFFPAVLLLVLWSCNTIYAPQSLQHHQYRVSDSQPKDTAVLDFLQPYSEQVNKTMNEVVGVAARSLEKKQPEGILGNFMVNAFLVMAAEKYNMPVDVALMNHGGIRLTQLPAGPVTIGKIYELMPFDNVLLLQKMSGKVLQQFLDLTAAKGGWPVAGLTMQIRNGKAVNVTIGGKPIDPAGVYTVANSDFLANGGDNAEMFRGVPVISNGYLMRDALVDYIRKQKKEGKDIDAQIENRVTYAE
jgi:2',3'-cyclic-nucleotide 2'-phosphodiesterase (5'-nucleotidase family)